MNKLFLAALGLALLVGVCVLWRGGGPPVGSSDIDVTQPRSAPSTPASVDPARQSPARSAAPATPHQPSPSNPAAAPSTLTAPTVEFSGVVIDSDGKPVTEVGMFINSPHSNIMPREESDKAQRFVRPDAQGRFSTTVSPDVMGATALVGVFCAKTNVAFFQGYVPIGVGTVIQIPPRPQDRKDWHLHGAITLTGARDPKEDAVIFMADDGTHLAVQLGCNTRLIQVDTHQLWSGFEGYSGGVTLCLMAGGHTGHQYFRRRFESWTSCQAALLRGITAMTARVSVRVPGLPVPSGEADLPSRVVVKSAVRPIHGATPLEPVDAHVEFDAADGEYFVEGFAADERRKGVGVVTVANGAGLPLAWSYVEPGPNHSTVTVKANDRPVGGAKLFAVLLRPEHSEIVPGTFYSDCVTDADGRGVLGGLLPGEYRLSVRSEFGSPLGQTVLHVPGNPLFVDIGSTGRVLLDLQVPATTAVGRNWRVALRAPDAAVKWYTAGVDSPLGMVLDCVPTGSYEMLVVGPRHVGSQILGVGNGEARRVAVPMSQRREIRGTVLSSSGVPQPGLIVHLIVPSWGDEEIARCVTDESGRFRFLGAGIPLSVIVKRTGDMLIAAAVSADAADIGTLRLSQ